MIPPRQIASLLAVFAASCVCGSWVAGRAGRALSPAAVSQTPAKPTKAAQRPSSGGTIPAAAVKCLEEVRGAGDVQDKLRATIQLAQSLPLSELKAWFEGKWFDEKEDILSAVFYQIAISRWLAADPASLMRYCHLKEESRAALVAWEWALRDSRAAFAYLGEVHDTALREKMASHMAMALAIHQPEAAIGEMPLLLSTLGTHELWLLMAKLAETAPDTLKTAAANWPPYTREGIARELATVGLKRDLAVPLRSCGTPRTAGQFS